MAETRVGRKRSVGIIKMRCGFRRRLSVPRSTGLRRHAGSKTTEARRCCLRRRIFGNGEIDVIRANRNLCSIGVTLMRELDLDRAVHAFASVSAVLGAGESTRQDPLS